MNRGRRVGPGALAWLAALVLVAPTMASAAEPDPAASMYEPNTVVAIDLTLSPESEAALEAEPFEYVEATFSLAESDGTPEGIAEFGAPLSVGLRLKGKAGSFRPLSEKSAFKLKFNEFVDGQKFLGLKKMTLNNMVQDPSMVHETLSYGVFRAMDVRASRTGYAFVRLNGEPLGVYLNIENLDDVGLEKRFGGFDDPQHIYEGEYGVDVRAADVEDFEVDEGDDEDLSDLEAFAAAVAGSDPADWSERVAPHADLDQMTRMWAVENYVGNWDGYAGAPDDAGHDLPNNYYLFSDAAGVFQMLPWGTDQTWELDAPFGRDFDDGGGLLFEGCLTDLSCEGDYRTAAAELLETVPALDLDRAARCTAELLAPWQELEEPPVRPYGPAGIADGVEATREFIAARPGELADWLGVEAPEEGIDLDPCVEPDSIVITDPIFTGDPTETATPIAGPVQRLSIARSWVKGNFVATRFFAPSVGKVTQRVSTRIGGHRVRVCSAQGRAPGAGKITLRCRLSERDLEALESRSLDLRIGISFRPGDHEAQFEGRSLTVPRRP